MVPQAIPAVSDPVFAALVQVAEAAQDGLALLDSAQRFLYVSPSACTLLDIANEDVLGLEAIKHFPTQEHAAITACLSPDIRSPHRWTTIMHHDGGEHAIEFCALPCGVAGQQVIALTMRDVTEHRRAQRRATMLAGLATRLAQSGSTASDADLVLLAELTNGLNIKARLPSSDATQMQRGVRDNDAEYRVIFESAFDAMTITDLNGYCVEANPAACQMYGYSYDEMIGLNAAEVTPRESRELLRAFPDAIARGGPIEARAVNLRKGGIPFFAEARGRAIQYRGETHILSVIRDITAQVQAEERLREREEQYRSIFEATGEALIIADLNGYVVEANPAACRIYGYSRDELIGMHSNQITHQDYQHEIPKAAEATASGQTYATRAISIRKASPTGIVLQVRDDGAGFDTDGSFPGHLGLHTMRERAAHAAGTLEVTSAPGEGTLVRVEISSPAGS